jgi:hypothetical protein
MSRGARAFALTLCAVGAAIMWLPSAAHAFAIEKWEAGTCVESSCKDSEGPSSTKFYRQAAGHPNFGITDFRFKAETVGVKHERPEGNVKDVRVDLPPGLAVNPEATETCSEQQLDEYNCPAESQVGEDEATGTVPLFELIHLGLTETEHFPVYNMQRKAGQPARFAVEVDSSTLELLRTATGHDLRGQIYLEGGISWQHEPETSESSGVPTGDYHEFFKIQNIPTEPELIESKLIFWGVPQEHQTDPAHPPTAFITLPSTCSSNPNPVTYLHVDSYEAPGDFLAQANETPVAATGCAGLAFDPSLSLNPDNSQSDQPDGVSADLHVPQFTSEPSKPNSADVQSVQVTLPEGMTLNPAAAHGLLACTSSEFASGGCPGASEVGSVSVNAPGIPPGALAGGVYVGSPEPAQGPESGGMYRLFVLANSAYGVGLRLEGRVGANAQTGRLTATFAHTPEVPFEDFTIHFRGGPRAPLANPLGCGPVAPSAAILPYGGEGAKAAGVHGFSVSGCASPLPFSLVQSLSSQNPQAGAFSPFTFNLSRGDGQQYLSRLTTTLPAGLVGAIPSVALCGESEANAGTCPSSSEIGTVSVAAGAGSEPYVFTGRAYLTGPYNGAPYGLSVVVPAVAGPYDLGNVVTRAGIAVGMYSGRVTVTSSLPTVVGGVPLRLRGLSVAVNRPNFASNPTSCTQLATESTLISTSNASDALSSPFQANGCSALAFTPKLSVTTSAKTSKPAGASLKVELTQAAGQANISELQLQLPKQLVARFSTIQHACPAASFEVGPPPGQCASTARVGTVAVTTPVLPGQLTGTAWLVSHGSEQFPDLDLVLTGDNVEVVLVGHTHIARSSITTSTFEGLPDVPISNVTVDLPTGPNSALAAGTGRLCASNPVVPTTIVAQNGAKITQSTKIAVSGCSVVVLSHKRRGNHMLLTVWAPEAGRVTFSAPGIRTVKVRVRKAGAFKVSVPIPAKAMAAGHGHGKKLWLRVAFTPGSGHNSSGVRLALP